MLRVYHSKTGVSMLEFNWSLLEHLWMWIYFQYISIISCCTSSLYIKWYLSTSSTVNLFNDKGRKLWMPLILKFPCVFVVTNDINNDLDTHNSEHQITLNCGLDLSSYKSWFPFQYRFERKEEEWLRKRHSKFPECN